MKSVLPAVDWNGKRLVWSVKIDPLSGKQDTKTLGVLPQVRMNGGDCIAGGFTGEDLVDPLCRRV